MSDAPISIEMSNSLADLAARINAAHGSVITTFKARSAPSYRRGCESRHRQSRHHASRSRTLRELPGANLALGC
jgi:hypothetical protein